MRGVATSLVVLTACTFDRTGLPGVEAPVDAPDPAVDALAAPPDAEVCPSGYARLDETQHLYRAVAAPAVQAAAAADCADDGGPAHLLVIDDEDEDRALGVLVGNTDVWIGMTDAIVEDVWITVLGDQQEFFAWRGMEPNNSGDCAEREDADRWDDTACTEVRAYVCECAP